MAIVKSAPFQMRTKAPNSRETTDVHHQEAPVAAHVPAGHRRDGRAAVPRLDGRRRRRRLPAARRRRRPASPCFYVPHGATMDKWTPATEGTGFAFTEILKPLEPFRDRINVISGLAHPYVAGAGGADVSAGANHTRAAAVFLTGSVPERGAQAHLGVSADQVAARAHRPGHAAAVAGAVDRRVGAQLRGGVQLRVSQLDLVEVADRAAADAEQPAAGVREAVRRRQHRRGAARPSSGDAQPARLGDGAGGVAAEGSAGRRPPPADAVSRRCPRDRAAHSARRSVACAEDVEAARRADRRAADVRGAPQAPDGSAGDRVSVGNHARVDADVRARAEHRGLPGDQHPRSVPQPVAPLERSRATWIASRN